MPTEFQDLPYELREHIFELAANEEFHPRVVEIFRKDHEIFSKTAPPPLLHVCHESRNVTLRMATTIRGNYELQTMEGYNQEVWSQEQILS
jgi:hypothetical protein